MTRFQTRLKLRREPREVPKRDSLADCLHDVKEKVKIVVGVQDGPQYFIGAKEMTKISARVPPADHTATVLVERSGIVDKFGILDEQWPLVRIEISVSRVPRW